VGVLLQVPSLAVSVWPTVGVPEIEGGAVFAGGAAAAVVAKTPAAAAPSAAAAIRDLHRLILIF
jgi:hypothetical protein